MRRRCSNSRTRCSGRRHVGADRAFPGATRRITAFRGVQREGVNGAGLAPAGEPGGWPSHDLRILRDAIARVARRDRGDRSPRRADSLSRRRPLELITASDTVTQVVLGFLALLSAISWTIIFAKWLEYRQRSERGPKVHAGVRAGRGRSKMPRASPARGKPNPVHPRLHARERDSSPTPRRRSRPRRSAAARLSAAQVEALRQVLDSQTDAERDALGRLPDGAGDHRLGESADRAARNCVRRHISVPRHDAEWVREHRGRGPGRRPGPDGDRDGARRGHSSGVRVQHLREPAERDRRRAWRGLDRS